MEGISCELRRAGKPRRMDGALRALDRGQCAKRRRRQALPGAGVCALPDSQQGPISRGCHHRLLRTAAARQPSLRRPIHLSCLRHSRRFALRGFAQHPANAVWRTGLCARRGSHRHSRVHRFRGERFLQGTLHARCLRFQAGHQGQEAARAHRWEAHRSLLHSRPDRSRRPCRGARHRVGRRSRRLVFDAGPGLGQGSSAGRTVTPSRLCRAERSSILAAGAGRGPERRIAVGDGADEGHRDPGIRRRQRREYNGDHGRFGKRSDASRRATSR